MRAGRVAFTWRLVAGARRMADATPPRQRWPSRHPILTTVGSVIVGIFLIAAIFGSSSSSSTTTETATVTQTVTHIGRSDVRTRTRTVLRRTPAPAPTTVTITRTQTQTTTVAGSTGPSHAASVEGPGSTSHATDSEFCSTHACIANFPNGNGSIVQCSDGEWSHSGGLSGACSDHGGES